MENINDMWDSLIGEPEKIRLTTCYGLDCDNDFYSKMTKEQPENNNTKTFESDTGLFVTALLVGYINNNRSENFLYEKKKKHYQFRRANSLKADSDHEAISRMVFVRTFPAEDDEYLKKYLDFFKDEEEDWKRRKAHWAYFCSIADAGIEIMIKHHAIHNRIDFNKFDDELSSSIAKQMKDLKQELESTNTS